MSKQHRNIYRIARDDANMTRELAAEALNLSVKSIQAFEDGETPCCAYVLEMARIYDAPDLPLRHLTQVCPVGAACLPAIVDRDAPLSVFHLQKEIRDVQDLQRDVEAAVCEGTITKMTKFRKELWDLVSASLTLLNCHSHEKKEAAPVLSHRGRQMKPDITSVSMRRPFVKAGGTPV